jgi:hypothetical protein
MECKDALEDEDVRRVNGGSLVQTGMLLEGVYGDLGTFATVESTPSATSGQLLRDVFNSPSLQITQSFYQNIKVQSLWWG